MEYHINTSTLSKISYLPKCTASEACKRSGFKSLEEVARLSGWSSSAIWRKFNKKPHEFYALLEKARGAQDDR